MVTFPILPNKTTSEHTLPIFLNDTRFDDSLSSDPQTLKEYILQYKPKKEIFDLKEIHDITNIESSNKNSFTNNLTVDIIVFKIILYLLCKHNKSRAQCQCCASTSKRSRCISNET